MTIEFKINFNLVDLLSPIINYFTFLFQNHPNSVFVK
jgi:hypothetical protein